jgi:hypothetical protein
MLYSPSAQRLSRRSTARPLTPPSRCAAGRPGGDQRHRQQVGWGIAGRGHGLAGLADRLRGVDGTLTVSSPGSGPTSLTATLPRLRPDAHSPSLVLTNLGGEGR